MKTLKIIIQLKPKIFLVFKSEFKALREDFTPDFENEDKIDSSIVAERKIPP